MSFDQLRRREQVAHERERDVYTASLREWSGLATAEELLPPGPARCVDCGRRDLLSVSTPDGRRVIVETDNDDGELTIVDGIARPKIGGDLAFHNCRRTS